MLRNQDFLAFSSLICFWYFSRSFLLLRLLKMATAEVTAPAVKKNKDFETSLFIRLKKPGFLFDVLLSWMLMSSLFDLKI